MATASLIVRVSAQIAEFQKSFAEVNRTLGDMRDTFEQTTTRAATLGATFGTIFGNLATSIARSVGTTLTGALRDAIDLSQKFSNALIGLSSVSRAFGTDAGDAANAAKRLASDGLLPIGDAATGLKNLLAAGFNLPQATKLMEAFKDSAAFGRQGALSFGDAVRSTTEGVKNGNSILVDNAGVTKNLSQILKEAGFSAQDLSRAASDVNVRMALYKGILRETAAQTGDAAKLTQTFTGQVSRLSSAYDTLLATFGDAVTKNRTLAIAIGAVGDAFQTVSSRLTDNKRGFELVSDAVIVLTRALAESLNAIDLLQTAFAGLQIAANTTFRAFADIGIALFKFQERAAGIMRFLDPVNYERHAAAVEEARNAYTFLEGALKGFDQASADSEARSAKWGNTLQELRAKLTTLLKELEKSRGQTVELGNAADGAGKAFGPLNDALTDGAVSGKAFAKTVESLTDQFSGREITTTLNAWFQALEKVGGTTRITAEHQARLNKLLQEALDTYRALGTTAPQAVLATFAALQKAQFQVPIVPQIDEDTIARELARRANLAQIAGAQRPEFRVPIVPVLSQETLDSAKGLLERAFGGGKQFASTLSQTILQAFTGGGNVAKSIGGFLGGGLGSSVVAGFAKKFSASALGSVLGSVIPGLGTILGGLGGSLVGKLFGGLFGGDAKKTNQARDALIQQAGGLDKLKAAAEQAGFSLDKLLSTKKSKEFQAEVDKLNAKIKQHEQAVADAQRRWEGLQVAVDGVNKKAELFASPFRKLIEARKELDEGDTEGLAKLDAKLAETAQRGQAEFERLGTFVAATFAGLVKESGDAIGALTALRPAFDVLKSGVDEFGLTTTGTIDQLLTMFRIVADEVTGPIFESLQATGQIFAGLQQAGLLTQDLFQTIGSDIGASFRELEAKGADMASALALSQPILQRLWEAQQVYGEITDETTQKILRQAQEQGLVGAHMKDVNQKILDVLIAIADVFGATIPDALRGLPSVAEETARDVEDAFKNIKVDPIELPFHYTTAGDVPGLDVPALAAGGIVTRPTLALIGERGPEAIVPLTGPSLGLARSGSQSGATVTANITIQALDGPSVQRVVASRDFADELERQLVRNTNGLGGVVRKVTA